MRAVEETRQISGQWVDKSELRTRESFMLDQGSFKGELAETSCIGAGAVVVVGVAAVACAAHMTPTNICICEQHHK